METLENWVEKKAKKTKGKGKKKKSSDQRDEL